MLVLSIPLIAFVHLWENILLEIWVIKHMRFFPFLFCLLLFLPSLTRAEEFSCDSMLSLQQQIDQADIIFSGTCIFVNSNWIAGGQKFVFEVEQTWKKRIDSLYIVNTKWEQEGGLYLRGRAGLSCVCRQRFHPQDQSLHGE